MSQIYPELRLSSHDGYPASQQLAAAGHHEHDSIQNLTGQAQQQFPARPSTILESNLFSVLLKRKRAFLFILFGVFAAASTIVLTMPKLYEAEMKFLVKNERQDLVISPDTNTNTIRSGELTETQINSEIELLRSKDVLRNVALQSGLSLPEPDSVQAAGEVSPVSLDKALNTLQRNLSVSVIKKSSIIDITYSSRDPKVASNVLNLLSSNYLEAHLKIHGAPGSYAFFEAQANSYKERLKQSEDQLKQFQQRNSSLILPDQDQALTSRSLESQAALEEVDAQVADYTQRISQGRQLLANLDPRVTTQMRTVPQGQLIGNLNQTLADLRNKRTDLVTKFRPDDRMVLETDKQIADTTAALQDALSQNSTEKQTDANPVREQVEKDMVASQVSLAGFLAKRAALVATANHYRVQMFNLAEASITHDQLVREVNENQENYVLYQKKGEEARIVESLDKQRITNVAIVQQPVTPVQPSSPKIKLDLLLSAILAAFLAFIAILLLEFRNLKPVVSSPDELLKSLPEPRPPSHSVAAGS